MGQSYSGCLANTVKLVLLKLPNALKAHISYLIRRHIKRTSHLFSFSYKQPSLQGYTLIALGLQKRDSHFPYAVGLDVGFNNLEYRQCNWICWLLRGQPLL